MTAVGPKQLGKQVEIFQSGTSLLGEKCLKCLYEISCDLVCTYCGLPWVVKFVIVNPPGYLEEHLAQSLPYILCDFCRMCTWDLQKSRCHVVLAVNCKTLGFHLTNLQRANKYVYTPRSQEIGIANDLGTISFFPKYSPWKESCVDEIEGLQLEQNVEQKRILWLLRSVTVLHRSGSPATGVSFSPQTGGAALVGSRWSALKHPHDFHMEAGEKSRCCTS